MTTAFVFSGGAAHGSIEVGMVQALAAAGIRPDLLIGTSVGALNAAYLAGHPYPDGIAGLVAIWRHIRREDVFPAQPLEGLRGLTGSLDHLVSADGLRKLLAANLTFDRLEDAPLPLHVVATAVTTGHAVLLSSGPAVEAVLASAAIPGVFAPRRIDGKLLMDGGIADNTPIAEAVSLGADQVYVLPASFPGGSTQPPRTAVAMLVHAISLLVAGRVARDVTTFESQIDLRVVPPLREVNVSPIDFRHADELIDRAHASTKAWLAAGPPGTGQAVLLNP